MLESASRPRRWLAPLSRVRIGLVAAALVCWGVAPLGAQSSAGTPTARQIALADTIARLSLEQAGPMKSMMPALPGMSESSSRMMKKTQEFFERLHLTDSLRAVTARHYAESFTEDELSRLLAFHRTDLGRKLMAQAPALAARMQAYSNSFLLKHMPELMKLMQEEVGAPEPAGDPGAR